jgi:hypothetical protein
MEAIVRRNQSGDLQTTIEQDHEAFVELGMGGCAPKGEQQKENWTKNGTRPQRRNEHRAAKP